MAEAGYSLLWSQQGCEIHHAQHGKLPIHMVQGCPTINAQWGEKLRQEMEKEGKRRAKIRMIMDCGIVAENTVEKEFAEMKGLFKAAPDYILEQLPGAEEWSGEALPFNRRRRRQIDKAKWVVVHAFSGPDKKHVDRVDRNSDLSCPKGTTCGTCSTSGTSRV